MYRKFIKWLGVKKKKKNPLTAADITVYPYYQDAPASPKPKLPETGVVYPSRTRSFRSILKEPVYAVQAKAVCDHHVPKDPHALSFQKGDIITVLEQRDDGRWKGMIFGDLKKGGSRSGYFSASAVNLLGKSERRNLTSGKVKKVLPPTVPDLNLKGGPQQRNSAASSGYSSSSSNSSSDNRSSLGSDSFPLPPSPVSLTPGPVDNKNWSVYDTAPRCNNTPTCCSCVSTYSTTSGGYKGRNMYMAPTYVKIPSPVDSGLDLHQIPSEDPVDSIEVCRESVSSLDSGRASTSYWDVAHSNHSSPRASASYSTASSSSLEERVTESDVAKLLVEQGLPDEEVLLMWLKGLHLPQLTSLFLTAGYDLPTIALMSPQDLSAVGVTEPSARKRLKERLERLRLPDPVPNYIPSSLEEWLSCLNLMEYIECLQSQGYSKVEDVTDLTWEDLEDIGITKLGHQKKIMLAIKRVSDILSGKRISRDIRHQDLPNVQEILITPHRNRSINNMGGSLGESVGGIEMQTFRQSFTNPIGHYATLRPLRRRRSSDSTCHRTNQDQWPVHLVDPDPLRCRKYTVFNSNGTLPRRKPIAKIQPASKSVEDKYDLMCSEDLKNKNNPYISDEIQKITPKFQKCMSVPNEYTQQNPPQRQYERSQSFSSYGYTRNQWNSQGSLPPPPLPDCQSQADTEEFPPPPTQDDLDKIHNSRTTIQVSVEVLEAPKKSEHPPALAELSSHPLFRQRRHDSTASNKSSSSTDSCDSLPFAKENVGTLKSKSKSGESSPTDGLPPRPPACTKTHPGAKPSLKRSGPGIVGGNEDVLEEIGSMLSDLSSELDAMIVTEQRKETHV